MDPDNRRGIRRFFPRLYDYLRDETQTGNDGTPRPTRAAEIWELMQDTGFWRWQKAWAWLRRRGNK